MDTSYLLVRKIDLLESIFQLKKTLFNAKKENINFLIRLKIQERICDLRILLNSIYSRLKLHSHDTSFLSEYISNFRENLSRKSMNKQLNDIKEQFIYVLKQLETILEEDLSDIRSKYPERRHDLLLINKVDYFKLWNYIKEYKIQSRIKNKSLSNRCPIDCLGCRTSTIMAIKYHKQAEILRGKAYSTNSINNESKKKID